MLTDYILAFVHEIMISSDPNCFLKMTCKEERSKIQRLNVLHNGTYLVSSHFQRFPVYPWENVAQERRVVFNIRLLKIGVFKMEGKGKRRSLACFDGTGQEIYCQNFHL